MHSTGRQEGGKSLLGVGLRCTATAGARARAGPALLLLGLLQLPAAPESVVEPFVQVGWHVLDVGQICADIVCTHTRTWSAPSVARTAPVTPQHTQVMLEPCPHGLRCMDRLRNSNVNYAIHSRPMHAQGHSMNSPVASSSCSSSNTSASLRSLS